MMMMMMTMMSYLVAEVGLDASVSLMLVVMCGGGHRSFLQGVFLRVSVCVFLRVFEVRLGGVRGISTILGMHVYRKIWCFLSQKQLNIIVRSMASGAICTPSGKKVLVVYLTPAKRHCWFGSESILNRCD